MKIPHLRDRVQVDGDDGTFVVASINTARCVVDLACISRVAYLVDVPFQALLAAQENRSTVFEETFRYKGAA